MLITHDLGVVAEMADYVVVMYAGKVVEETSVLELYKNPTHPYTIGLLQSKPVINRETDKLYSIPGQVPNPLNMPTGCYFNPRCSRATDKCREAQPTLVEATPGHKVACWNYKEGN
jgi:peptide/nickel transport system ATP-binding protein